tara:strand:- start:2748 stop:3491 length:744 start_codon:yes stop_codon:yes gene_type:complete
MIVPGKVQEITLNKKKINLHCITDVHVGSKVFDRLLFLKVIDKIKKDPNAFWFGNGDMLEFIPPNYHIPEGDQAFDNNEQYEQFVNMIRPIKHKCLFVRGGNHDTLRSVRLAGIDIIRVMCDDLEIPYFPFPGYTVINYKGGQFTFASGHGKGGGKNGDLELQRLRNIFPEADMYYLGHNHQLYAKPIDSFEIMKENEEVRRQWFVRGGSFIGYAEYARYAMFEPQTKGWVEVRLSSKEPDYIVHRK